MPIVLKRVYEAPAAADGTRVLVDRLWPRGVSKEEAQITFWLRDLAPSNELRKWYHARPTMWEQFRQKYLQELRAPEASAALEHLQQLANKSRRLTLLFASRNEDRNNASVLKELLEGKKPPHKVRREVAPAAQAQQARVAK